MNNEYPFSHFDIEYKWVIHEASGAHYLHADDIEVGALYLDDDVLVLGFAFELEPHSIEDSSKVKNIEDYYETAVEWYEEAIEEAMEVMKYIPLKIKKDHVVWQS